MSICCSGDVARREKSVEGRSAGQAVLFTDDARTVQQNKDLVRLDDCCGVCMRTLLTAASQVAYCGAAEQDVLCINEREVMVRSRAMYDQSAPNVALEGVEADLGKR